MPHITKELLERLQNDEDLVFAIAKGMKRKFRTVENWVRDNDEMLASQAVVLIIKHEADLTESEILEPEKNIA